MCEISECGVRAHDGATEVSLNRRLFQSLDSLDALKSMGKPWENHGKPWKTMENHGKHYQTSNKNRQRSMKFHQNSSWAKWRLVKVKGKAVVTVVFKHFWYIFWPYPQGLPLWRPVGRQVLRQDGRKLVLQHRKAAGTPNGQRLGSITRQFPYGP